eukprot:3557885-Pleurochrysis_carterae.AAC.1
MCVYLRTRASCACECVRARACVHASQSHKDVSVFYGNRAQCFASLDKHAEAEADCDAALAIAPDYVKALCRRAIAREKQARARARACVHACVRGCVHVCVRACVRACARACARAC